MTTRILAAFLGFTALVLVMLVLPLGIANQRSERADLTTRVERDAVAVAAIAAEPLRTHAGTKPPTKLTNYLKRYDHKTGARVVVTDASGGALVDTERATTERGTHAARSFAS